MSSLEIFVISVADTINHGYVGPLGILNEYYNEIANETRKSTVHIIKQTVEILQKESVHTIIYPIFSEGDPKKIILAKSEELGIDLIVLGSHGYNAFNRLLLGSVSQGISLHAKCSVLIIRTDDKHIS